MAVSVVNVNKKYSFSVTLSFPCNNPSLEEEIPIIVRFRSRWSERILNRRKLSLVSSSGCRWWPGSHWSWSGGWSSAGPGLELASKLTARRQSKAVGVGCRRVTPAVGWLIVLSRRRQVLSRRGWRRWRRHTWSTHILICITSRVTLTKPSSFYWSFERQ